MIDFGDLKEKRNTWHEKYLDDLDRLLMDYHKFSLKNMFPIPNDGIIKHNRYYMNNAVPLYLCSQAQWAIEAYKTSFLGGVYFLRDRKRKILKVGCSRDISKRVREHFKMAQSFAMGGDLVVYGMHRTVPSKILWLEKWYHEHLKSYKYESEWFNITFEEYNEKVVNYQPDTSIRIKTFFADFDFIFSKVDLMYEEIAPAIDLWLFTRDQIHEMLEYEYLLKNQITILVQDYRGDIIPFGWCQYDIDWLNYLGLWNERRITCFQKERLLSVGTENSQDDFL